MRAHMEILLIGIGTGNPEHLTLQAIRAMNRADLILIPRKGADKADLAELRRELCTGVLKDPDRIAEFDMPVRDPANPSYLARVEDWHDTIAIRWAEAIAARPNARVIALLVWGDPSLYDSSLRIAARLGGDGPIIQNREEEAASGPKARQKQAGKLPLFDEVKVTAIPGLMSPQVLTTAHGIPLNDLGAPFLVTTGRRLREGGWPHDVDRLVVMLDGECSFAGLDPEGIIIWWGAYVGMENQILDHGPLAEAGPRIQVARAEARAAHGWIMDIYLLQRDHSARGP